MTALLTIILSFAGALVCGLMPSSAHRRIRWVALAVAVAGLVVSMVCCVNYSGGKFEDLIQLDTEQRSHGALANRDRRLHGLATCFKNAGGIGELKRARRGQRGILTKGMAGDEFSGGGQIEIAFAVKHAEHCHAHRHQSRLGIFGQNQLLFRAFEHEPGKVLFE